MAKRKAADSGPVAVADVVENPDVTLAKQDGGLLATFIGGMQAFFRTAAQLEASAKEKLERAKTWQPPTTAEEDAEIQRQIKAATQDGKGIDDWWEITSRVSQFHKRLVAGRERPKAYLEEAKRIWNQQHNDYVAAENRKAAAENERRRREAEAQAEADRVAELAKAEADALKLEAASADLSARETTFVNYYHTNHGRPTFSDATAARVAGYKDPAGAAMRLLETPKIKKAIEAKQSAEAIRDQATALATQPLDVKPIEEKRPNIGRAAGAHDRTTWSGVLDDEAAIRDAAFDQPDLGIPRDLFVVDPTKLNQYARQLEQRLDAWPGVHAVKKTGVV